MSITILQHCKTVPMALEFKSADLFNLRTEPKTNDLPFANIKQINISLQLYQQWAKI